MSNQKPTQLSLGFGDGERDTQPEEPSEAERCAACDKPMSAAESEASIFCTTCDVDPDQWKKMRELKARKEAAKQGADI